MQSNNKGWRQVIIIFEKYYLFEKLTWASTRDGNFVPLKYVSNVVYREENSLLTMYAYTFVCIQMYASVSKDRQHTLYIAEVVAKLIINFKSS